MTWLAIEPLAEIPIGYAGIIEDEVAIRPFAPGIPDRVSGLQFYPTGGLRLDFFDYAFSLGIAFTILQIGSDMEVNYLAASTSETPGADQKLIIPGGSFSASSPTFVVGALQDLIQVSFLRYRIENDGPRFFMLDPATQRDISVGPGELFSEGWAFTIGIGVVSLIRSAATASQKDVKVESPL